MLDLFAGTGALGIEALSRGAESLVALDRSQKSVSVIQRNFQALGLASHARVQRIDARVGLRRLAEEGAGFDLAFLDPPYADPDELSAVLEALGACDILHSGATVIAEGPKNHSLPPVPGLSLETTRRYGDTAVHWFYADSEERTEFGDDGKGKRNG